MKVISTNKAAQAIGPYSQAIKTSGLIFTSGQIPYTKDGKLAGESIEEQTKQVLENLKAILDEAGAKFEDVIKTTIFLADINDFDKVNEIYAQTFSSHKPARSCVEVSRLPKDVKIEIELIAKA
ncbi:RidA family protein [Campylobacter corcagiensis]|uniref:RidA family protein n=1 Tax=Campylobacter corcagiensis TaxID=1448857 RepID=A0A7M1LFY3_9BACT|nr:RidA family protein [Campylobacter corcagiensis]QKF64343.1 reactive intermediate/imine deaminase [Campylobacter corcagiensis]QOQ87468.1 RidA family protein [Campylobacter corcagiensis]